MEREGEKGLNTARRVEGGENPLRPPRFHLLQDRQRNEESNATRVKEI